MAAVSVLFFASVTAKAQENAVLLGRVELGELPAHEFALDVGDNAGAPSQAAAVIVEAWPALTSNEIVRQFLDSDGLVPVVRATVAADGWYRLALPSGRRWRLVARRFGDEHFRYPPKEITVLSQPGPALLPLVTLTRGQACKWTLRSAHVSPLKTGGSNSEDQPIHVVVWPRVGETADPLVWRPAVQVVAARSDGDTVVQLNLGLHDAATVGSMPDALLAPSCGDVTHLGHAVDAEGLAEMISDVESNSPAVGRRHPSAAEVLTRPGIIRVTSESGFAIQGARAWLLPYRPGSMPRPSQQSYKRFPFRGFGAPSRSSGPLAPTAIDVTRASRNTETAGETPKVGPQTALLETVASTEFAVIAWAPGYAPSQRILASVFDRDTGSDIKLRSALRVEGRVLDVAGRPIEGAAVRVEGMPGYWVAGSALLLQSITEADGRYSLSGLPAGGYSLVAAKKGIGRGSASLPPPSASSAVLRRDIVLRPSYRIFGAFADHSGRPINGVDVGVTSRRNAAAWIGPPSGWPRRSTAGGKTDEQGQFQIHISETLARRQLALVAWEANHITTAISLPELTDAGDIDLGILLTEPSERIEVLVTDTSGHLIENAALQYANARAGAEFPAIASTPMLNPALATREGDRFIVGGVKADQQLHLQASAEGYVREVAYGVHAGDSPLTIILERGVEVRFGIADEAGRPLHCSRLVLNPSGVTDAYSISRDCEPGQGQTVRGIPPGTYLAEIFAPEHETWSEQLDLSQDRRVSVAMRSAGATVNGEISADQSPLQGAHIRLGSTRAVSDFSGRFSLRTTTGWQTLDVMDPRSGEITSRPLEVEPGRNRVKIDLSRRRFGGQVLDAGGAPVAEAYVDLTAASSNDHYSTITDASGFFRIGVYAGRYGVSVSSRRGSAEDQVDLTGPSIENRTLRLEATGRIEITVTPLRDEETAQTWISRYPLDRDFALSPGADGIFRARSAALGEWFITTATSAGRRGFASVVLTEGQPSQSVAVVLDDFAVTGQVRIDGTALAGVAVFLMHEQSLGVRSTYSTARGEFSFLGTQPGRYLLMAETQVQSIEVPLTSDPLLLDVDLGEAGIVVIGDGRLPMPAQIRVELWPERLGRDLAQQLGVVRRYQIGRARETLWTGRIPTGNYRLQLDAPGVSEQTLIRIETTPNVFPIEF